MFLDHPHRLLRNPSNVIHGEGESGSDIGSGGSSVLPGSIPHSPKFVFLRRTTEQDPYLREEGEGLAEGSGAGYGVIEEIVA